MLKSHKITETTGRHSCSQLAVRAHPPPPTALFQLKLKKKPISLLYTSGSRGVVKRHNHIKIGINDPELLHYRSGKSKSTFVNVQKSLFATTLTSHSCDGYLIGEAILFRLHLVCKHSNERFEDLKA